MEIAWHCLLTSSDLLLNGLSLLRELCRPLVFLKCRKNKKNHIVLNLRGKTDVICLQKWLRISLRLIDVYWRLWCFNTPRTFNYMFMCVVLIIIINQLLIFYEWHLAFSAGANMNIARVWKFVNSPKVMATNAARCINRFWMYALLKHFFLLLFKIFIVFFRYMTN